MHNRVTDEVFTKDNYIEYDEVGIFLITGIICILDDRTDYMTRLADAIFSRGQDSSISTFSSAGKFMQHCSGRRMDLVILGGNYADGDYWEEKEEEADNLKRLISAVPKLFLTEYAGRQSLILREDTLNYGNRQDGGYTCRGHEEFASVDEHMAECRTISRYQPVSKICEEVESLISISKESQKDRAFITEVYTPVSHCGSTSIALALASMLAVERRVLFINLEENSGLESRFDLEPGGWNLADLFYEYMIGRKLPESFEAACDAVGGVKMLRMPAWCTDFRDISLDIMAAVIRELAESGKYDDIIIDVGRELRCPVEILSEADRLLMPQRIDIDSVERVRKFESSMQAAGRDDILRHRVEIPMEADWSEASDWNLKDEDYLSFLKDGQIGSQVRSLYEKLKYPLPVYQKPKEIGRRKGSGR